MYDSEEERRLHHEKNIRKAVMKYQQTQKYKEYRCSLYCDKKKKNMTNIIDQSQLSEQKKKHYKIRIGRMKTAQEITDYVKNHDDLFIITSKPHSRTSP